MENSLNNFFRITKNETKLAVNTLVKAFETDPLYEYLIPDENKRIELLPKIFEFRVKFGLLNGDIYAISENIEGIAVWIPSKNSNITNWQIIKCGGIPLVFKAGKDVMRRISELEEFEEEIHKKYANFPYVHLSPIAVNPKFQRKGHAENLIKSMLEKLDKEKMPCFLETQNENNVLIYEKYGFKVVCEKKIPNSNIYNWSMLRDNR